MGVTGNYFSGGCRKKEKPARQGNRCAGHVYSPTRKVRKTKSSFSRSVVSDHVCKKGGMSALGQKQTFSDHLPNVRFGSKADVIQGVAECTLIAKSGHRDDGEKPRIV